MPGDSQQSSHYSRARQMVRRKRKLTTEVTLQLPIDTLIHYEQLADLLGMTPAEAMAFVLAIEAHKRGAGSSVGDTNG